jgi:hypothetical protein
MLTQKLLGAAGGPAELLLTYDQIVSSATETITIPETSQVGDLAILVDTPLGSSVPTLVIPSGWSSVYNFLGSASSNVRASFSYRVLTSGEPGSSITGMTGTVANRKSIMVFRPNKPIAGVTGGGGTGTVTNGTPSAQTITSSSQSPPALAIGVALSSGTVVITADTMTIVATDVTTRSLLYAIMNTTTSNHTFSSTDAGFNNTLAGCYFAVT